MINDERIGKRTRRGGLGEMPSRYGTGGLYSKRGDPNPTVVWLTENHYCLMQIGMARLPDSVRRELLDIIEQQDGQAATGISVRPPDEPISEADRIQKEREEAQDAIRPGETIIIRRKKRKG